MPSGVDDKKPESQPARPGDGGQRERGGRLELAGGDRPEPLPRDAAGPLRRRGRR